MFVVEAEIILATEAGHSDLVTILTPFAARLRAFLDRHPAPDGAREVDA